METTETGQELQTDEFIEAYLKEAVNIFESGQNLQDNSERKKVEVSINGIQDLSYDVDIESWEKQILPIQAQLQQMFDERVKKIHKDLIMQDQYIQHQRLQNNNILFGHHK